MVEFSIRVTAFILLSIALSALISDLCSKVDFQEKINKYFPPPNDNSSALFNNTHTAIHFMKDYQKTSSVVLSSGVASLVVLSPVRFNDTI